MFFMWSTLKSTFFEMCYINKLSLPYRETQQKITYFSKTVQFSPVLQRMYVCVCVCVCCQKPQNKYAPAGLDFLGFMDSWKSPTCFSSFRQQSPPSQPAKVTPTREWWSYPRRRRGWASTWWAARSRTRPSTSPASSREAWPSGRAAWSEGISCCPSTAW